MYLIVVHSPHGITLVPRLEHTSRHKHGPDPLSQDRDHTGPGLRELGAQAVCPGPDRSWCRVMLTVRLGGAPLTVLLGVLAGVLHSCGGHLHSESIWCMAYRICFRSRGASSLNGP